MSCVVLCCVVCVYYLLLINYYNIIHIFITMSKKVAKKPQAEK